MLILLLFAFLAGIFTVLSPCILPILPVILSAGTAKGRWRPLGIILGLILSFTFFTLTLTALVHATGLSANFLRYLAIALIFLFGIIMIFPRLSEWFANITSPIANLGQKVQAGSSGNGLIGGFLLGIALGLLWTPCAGPILAAITTLVATQSISVFTVAVTLAYTIGAAIPMFFIAYGSGLVIQSSKYLSTHAEGIRQFFGGLMVLTAIAIAFHWDMLLQQKIISYFPPVLVEDNPIVKEQLSKLRTHPTSQGGPRMVFPDEMSNFGKSPELTGIVNWINSPPLSLMQLQGKVVLIDFWTYSCINCLRTLPYLKQWYADYKDRGLVIIGVHTPEFEFEKDPKNVAEAVARLGVTYPVAQDNDYLTWQAFSNSYWPAHYLIDQEGNLRLVHFGEGKYVETENAIRQLLGLPMMDKKEPGASHRHISPETYLGIFRASHYTSQIVIKPEQQAEYHYEQPLADDEVGLKGPWEVLKERIVAKGGNSFLDLNFLATKVYLVLSGYSKVPMEVYLDGKKVHEFLVDGDRKYDIVSASYARHQLSLKVPEGISAYAFTFGDE